MKRAEICASPREVESQRSGKGTHLASGISNLLSMGSSRKASSPRSQATMSSIKKSFTPSLLMSL